MSTEKYGKTPNFSGKQHFYSYFQNPSENYESLQNSADQTTALLGRDKNCLQPHDIKKTNKVKQPALSLPQRGDCKTRKDTDSPF